MATPARWIVPGAPADRPGKIQHALDATLDTLGGFGLRGPDRFQDLEDVLGLDILNVQPADHRRSVGAKGAWPLQAMLAIGPLVAVSENEPSRRCIEGPLLATLVGPLGVPGPCRVTAGADDFTQSRGILPGSAEVLPGGRAEPDLPRRAPPGITEYPVATTGRGNDELEVAPVAVLSRAGGIDLPAAELVDRHGESAPQLFSTFWCGS